MSNSEFWNIHGMPGQTPTVVHGPELNDEVVKVIRDNGIKIKLDKALDALHSIMVEGTGPHGNTWSSTVAYETLGELGYFDKQEDALNTIIAESERLGLYNEGED